MHDEFLDRNEKFTYPIFILQEHFFEIVYGQRFGFADLGGNIKVPVKEYECVFCECDFIAVKEFDNDDWQLFEVYNDEIIELIYEEVIYRKGEFFLVKIDGHWEFYDFEEYDEEYDEEYEEYDEEYEEYDEFCDDFVDEDGDYDE